MEEGLIEFGNSRKVGTAISRVFAYDANNVTFAMKGDLVMVNATQMAKKFGKLPADWLKTSQTKEFISTYSDMKKIISADLVRVTKGGCGAQGTWLQEDVAIEFARWLSPAFAIWCNDRIKELLTTGTTSVRQYHMPQTYAEALRELASKVEENERLAVENKRQAETLKEQRPKVIFAESITGSETNILIRDLAKLICQNGYDIGEKRLYQWMRDNGYLCTYGQNYNRPMQRYVDQGLFFIKEGSHSENGRMKSNFTTMVTGKGQQYFINKFICREPMLFEN